MIALLTFLHVLYIQLTDTQHIYFKYMHNSSLCYSLVQFHLPVMMEHSSSNVQGSPVDSFVNIIMFTNY